MTKRMIMLGGWTDIYRKAKKLGFNLTVIQQKSAVKWCDIELVDRYIDSAVSVG